MTNIIEPTVIPTETELAYIAGLFDGEGCVSIYAKYDEKNDRRYHALNVSIANGNSAVLRWVQARLGGRLNNNGVGGKGAARDCWSLRWSNTQTVEFLTAVLPYLIVKREAAEIGLEFRKTVTAKVDCRTGIPAGVIGRREQLHERLAAINGYRLTRGRAQHGPNIQAR